MLDSGDGRPSMLKVSNSNPREKIDERPRSFWKITTPGAARAASSSDCMFWSLMRCCVTTVTDCGISRNVSASLPTVVTDVV